MPVTPEELTTLSKEEEKILIHLYGQIDEYLKENWQPGKEVIWETSNLGFRLTNQILASYSEGWIVKDVTSDNDRPRLHFSFRSRKEATPHPRFTPTSEDYGLLAGTVKVSGGSR